MLSKSFSLQRVVVQNKPRDTWRLNPYEFRVSKGKTLDSHGFGRDYAKSPFHSTSHMFTSMFSNLDPFTSLDMIVFERRMKDCKNSSRDHRAHPVRKMWQLTVTPSHSFFPKTTPGFPGALCEDSPRKCLGQDSSSHLSWVSEFLWYVHEGTYSSWAGGNGRAGHK